MDTDLTSISTFGWYQGQAVIEELTPISTFGWFLTFVLGTGTADTLFLDLCINTMMEITLER